MIVRGLKEKIRIYSLSGDEQHNAVAELFQRRFGLGVQR